MNRKDYWQTVTNWWESVLCRTHCVRCDVGEWTGHELMSKRSQFATRCGSAGTCARDLPRMWLAALTTVTFPTHLHGTGVFCFVLNTVSLAWQGIPVYPFWHNNISNQSYNGSRFFWSALHSRWNENTQQFNCYYILIGHRVDWNTVCTFTSG